MPHFKLETGRGNALSSIIITHNVKKTTEKPVFLSLLRFWEIGLVGCEIDGTIMHRCWKACLRELPWVCGDLWLVGVSFIFDKGIDSLDNQITSVESSLSCKSETNGD